MSDSKVGPDTQVEVTNEKDIYSLDYSTTGAQHFEATQRWNFNLYLVFGGVLLNGLVTAWVGAITFALFTTILSSLKSFDLNGIPDVVTVLFNILALPLYGKFSDIFGRAKVLTVAFLFLIAGNLVIGIGNINFTAYTTGSILVGVGETGKALLIPVILADLLIVENRGFGFFLYYLPSFCAIFLSLPLIVPATAMGWNWLYIIVAIGIVVSSIPLLLGLVRETKGRSEPREHKSLSWSLVHEIDLIGLVLLVISLALILIPFTIVIREPLGFASPTIISMLCVGGVFLVGLFVWEFKFCKNPLIPKRLFQNKNLMVIIFVNAFLKFESSINWQYFTSYLIISRGISDTHAALLNRGFQISWYIAGFVAGALLKKFKWTRSLIWVGCFLNVLGIALTIPARHPGSSDAFIIIVEALIGTGGGFITCIVLVMCQSSVEPKDLATISYIVSLLDSVVASIGGAVATATWNGTFKNNLIYYLPEEYTEQVPTLISDLFSLEKLPLEVKEFWIHALGDSQLVMCSVSLSLACIGAIAAFFIKPLRLKA